MITLKQPEKVQKKCRFCGFVSTAGIERCSNCGKMMGGANAANRLIAVSVVVTLVIPMCIGVGVILSSLISGRIDMANGAVFYAVVAGLVIVAAAWCTHEARNMWQNR